MAARIRRPRNPLVMFLAFTKIRLAGMSASKKQSTREIERKFLLKRFPPGLKKFPHDTIEQGYLGGVILLARPGASPDLHELPPLEHLYVVDKPFTTQALLRTLRKALGGAGGGG